MIADDNGKAVAEFIRTKGITRCPTACVLPTQALVGAADRAALQAHAVASDRVRRARGVIAGGIFESQSPIVVSGCPFPKTWTFRFPASAETAPRTRLEGLRPRSHSKS